MSLVTPWNISRNAGRCCPSRQVRVPALVRAPDPFRGAQLYFYQDTFRNTGSSLVSPKRVVGCRVGSRYVEGCWEFPYLKIKRFLGFLVCCFFVSWFLGLSVYWFLGFLVFSCSTFLDFDVSLFRSLSGFKFQIFTKFPFYVFWERSMPYPRFSRCR